jgi:hypothetical protein
MIRLSDYLFGVYGCYSYLKARFANNGPKFSLGPFKSSKVGISLETMVQYGIGSYIYYYIL